MEVLRPQHTITVAVCVKQEKIALKCKNMLRFEVTLVLYSSSEMQPV